MVVDIVKLYGPGMSFYLAETKGIPAPDAGTEEEKQSSLEVRSYPQREKATDRRPPRRRY